MGKLQGFIGYAFIDENGEDRFTTPPKMSNTQLYKQFGNSVTIPVIEQMAIYMNECIVFLNNELRKEKENMNKQFKFIDLFAGIGGFHYGLNKCGGVCVLASEIDNNACESYYKNYGISPVGDICELKSNEVPQFDLLCAGFPCQSFSNIGTKED